jgi:hypothetical protein
MLFNLYRLPLHQPHLYIVLSREWYEFGTANYYCRRIGYWSIQILAE